MNRSIRVVFAGHSEDEVSRVADLLSGLPSAFSVSTTTSAADVLDHVRAGRVDCAVLSTPLSEFEADTIIQRIQTDTPEFPVLLLTSSIDSSTPSSRVTTDATDVVLWDLLESRPNVVASRIENLVQLHHRSEENRTHEHRERHQQHRVGELVDVLTDDVQPSLKIITQYVETASSELDAVTPDSESNVALDAAQDALGDAQQRLARTDDVLADLVTLATNGSVVDDPVTVDVRGIAEDVWASLDTASAELSVEENLTIRASRVPLKNMFRELFENSLEHAPEDENDNVRVEIGALPSGDGIYVSDTGTGFPDDLPLEEAFDAGRSSNSGSGLGLAIVERVAQAHGWEVDAEPRVDGESGARFRFRLDP